MSSKRIATLCKGGSRQCEGYSLVRKSHGLQPSDQISTAQALATLSQYWQLERPVLLIKGGAGDGEWSDILRVEGNPLPMSMPHAGIQTLTSAYVFMWRPWCMAVISSHAREEATFDSRNWAQLELEITEYQVLTHQGLQVARDSARPPPTLVVSYADLLWEPERTRQRLMSFLPCVGPIDFGYVPKVGVDIFEGNLWNLTGSVMMYREDYLPAHCGYDPTLRRCKYPNTIYGGLDAGQRMRAEAAVAYLDAAAAQPFAGALSAPVSASSSSRGVVLAPALASSSTSSHSSKLSPAPPPGARPSLQASEMSILWASTQAPEGQIARSRQQLSQELHSIDEDRVGPSSLAAVPHKSLIFVVPLIGLGLLLVFRVHIEAKRWAVWKSRVLADRVSFTDTVIGKVKLRTLPSPRQGALQYYHSPQIPGWAVSV